MLSVQEKIKIIMKSKKISDVQTTEIMPEPSAGEGYYFVSYSHKDYKYVFCTVLELMEAGIKLWYDRGLETGKSWLASVKNRINSFDCKGVIFFVSDSFVLSESIKEEVLQTYKQKKPVLVLDISEEFADSDEPVGILCDINIQKALAGMLNDSNVLEKEDCTTENIVKKLKKMPVPRLLRYRYDEYLDGALLSRVSDLTVKNVVVPATARLSGNNVPVAGIKELCFANCTQMKSFKMADGWRQIEEKAFHNCRNLEELDLARPGEEARFCLNALDHCVKLKELKFPSNVIVDASFESAPTNSVERLIIVKSSDETNYVGRFEGMRKLEYADISVCDVISEAAFKDCLKLKEVVLGDKLKKIEASAFHGCESLERIEIPGSVNAIDPFAFANCISFSRTDLCAERELKIGVGAFYGCRQQKEVQIKTRDLSVDYTGFACNDELESVEIECAKARLELNSFALCKKLSRVKLDCGKIGLYDFKEQMSDTEVRLLAGEGEVPPIVKDVKIDDVFAFAKEIYLKKGCRAKFRKKFRSVASEDGKFNKYVLEEE